MFDSTILAQVEIIYEPVMSLPRNVNLMAGNRDLRKFLLAIMVGQATDDKFRDHFGDKVGDFSEKMKDLENVRILFLSLLWTELWGTLEMILGDVTSCRKRYKNPEVLRTSLNIFGILSQCEL
ncbi:hypothetical protein AVEN_187011-1 [Araneus ventricosus]|uniref:Uncharacterized protein n=1 Tax=Araneus ventricosus TaxID=182803 RepID=A0A4Y2S7M8_ARAVE|nr:hypothetical protein AVEN_187011-1 [Araneus ventricosus]